MGQRTILLVEDEDTLSRALKYSLEKEGYAVRTATDGAKGLALARETHPDLVLLDLMLPTMDGLEVCRVLRRETTIPILILTAKVDEVDKVVGLELGADDYVTKPFSLRELLARIKAQLRRTEMNRASPPAADGPAPLKAEGLEVDPARRKGTLNGAPLQLRPKEFDLLAFLMKNRGIVFTRETLLERVWGYEYAGDPRTVDVHIRWLREKVEADPSNPRLLLTVRGVGYKFEG